MIVVERIDMFLHLPPVSVFVARAQQSERMMPIIPGLKQTTSQNTGFDNSGS
jgi:hypothetical protein